MKLKGKKPDNDTNINVEISSYVYPGMKDSPDDSIPDKNTTEKYSKLNTEKYTEESKPTVQDSPKNSKLMSNSKLNNSVTDKLVIPHITIFLGPYLLTTLKNVLGLVLQIFFFFFSSLNIKSPIDKNVLSLVLQFFSI